LPPAMPAVPNAYLHASQCFRAAPLAYLISANRITVTHTYIPSPTTYPCGYSRVFRGHRVGCMTHTRVVAPLALAASLSACDWYNLTDSTSGHSSSPYTCTSYCTDL